MISRSINTLVIHGFAFQVVECGRRPGENAPTVVSIGLSPSPG